MVFPWRNGYTIFLLVLFFALGKLNVEQLEQALLASQLPTAHNRDGWVWAFLVWLTKDRMTDLIICQWQHTKSPLSMEISIRPTCCLIVLWDSALCPVVWGLRLLNDDARHQQQWKPNRLSVDQPQWKQLARSTSARSRPKIFGRKIIFYVVPSWINASSIRPITWKCCEPPQVIGFQHLLDCQNPPAIPLHSLRSEQVLVPEWETAGTNRAPITNHDDNSLVIHGDSIYQGS